MGKYGDAAILATTLVQKRQDKSVAVAWDMAVRQIFPGRNAAQKKGCPRGAYLGLCEEGLVKGVPKGDYTRSHDNKKYALDAVRLLTREPALASNGSQLWKRVINGEEKVENSQIDIVLSLWNKGLIDQQEV